MAKARPFTLRLPEDLYLQVANQAIRTGKTQNAICTELIRIGLGGKMDLRAAMQKLIDREFSDDDIAVES